MKIKDLKQNPQNPRKISKEKIKLLVKSIEEFPEMMKLRPIVHDNGVVLGGNMRLAAIISMGKKEIPDDWVQNVSEFSEEKKKEFLLKDNASFGEWDSESLFLNFGDLPLLDWGLPDLSEKINETKEVQIKELYEVIISCETEKEQQEIYEKLEKEGYSVRTISI